MIKTHCEKCRHFDFGTRVCEIRDRKIPDSYAKSTRMACPEFEEIIETPARIRASEPEKIKKSVTPDGTQITKMAGTGTLHGTQLSLF